LVPRHAAADHPCARRLRGESEAPELGLVAELVDREGLVVLPERPELIADRAIEDRRHIDGDPVPPRPPQEGLPAARPTTELPEEFLRRQVPPPGRPEIAEHGSTVRVHDDSVR